MIERLFPFSKVGNEKIVERLVDDDAAAINHMILPQGQSLPVHEANSNVYMIVIQGYLTLQLNQQDAHRYEAGQIVNIPFGTTMDVGNKDEAILEFFVVKSPNPRIYGK